MKNVKTRNSSIELLRIIAMLFIVLSHCVSHSNINMENLPMGFNKIFLQISTLGNLGVNLFLLITGFFSYNKKLNSQKIVYLWLNTLFYSLLTFFTIFLWTKDFAINVFIKSLFPITFNQYWFVTAFIIMMIVSPLLNKLIENISKREHFKLIIIGALYGDF